MASTVYEMEISGHAIDLFKITVREWKTVEC